MAHRLTIPGIGNALEGRLTSMVAHRLPFAIEVLAPMMIVGYPTYSEYKGSARDLFKPSTLQGGYKYQRDYRFSNGAHFNSFHNSRYESATNQLFGMFVIRNLPEERCVGDWRIQDLLETFIPHTPGRIKSIMAASWRDGDQSLHAIIESEYYVNHNEELPGLQWRHVKFANEHSDGAYKQSEKITVVDHFDFGSPIDQVEAHKATCAPGHASKSVLGADSRAGV